VATRVVAKICCVVGGVGRSSLGVASVSFLAADCIGSLSVLVLSLGNPGRIDKNLCRFFGAPACRLFPDHLISLDFWLA